MTGDSWQDGAATVIYPDGLCTFLRFWQHPICPDSPPPLQPLFKRVTYNWTVTLTVVIRVSHVHHWVPSYTGVTSDERAVFFQVRLSVADQKVFCARPSVMFTSVVGVLAGTSQTSLVQWLYYHRCCIVIIWIHEIWSRATHLTFRRAEENARDDTTVHALAGAQSTFCGNFTGIFFSIILCRRKKKTLSDIRAEKGVSTREAHPGTGFRGSYTILMMKKISWQRKQRARNSIETFLRSTNTISSLQLHLSGHSSVTLSHFQVRIYTVPNRGWDSTSRQRRNTRELHIRTESTLDRF